MKQGGGPDFLVRIARRLARAIVRASFWVVVDDEVREELAEKEGLGWSRWRTATWGATQYLRAAARLGAEGMLSFVWGDHGCRGVLRPGWGLDLKQALRALSLRRGPALTVIATVSIAVGATTSVYSVVDGVLLRPLPYPEPDRLVRVWQTRADWADSPIEGFRSRANRLYTNAPIYYDWLEADVGFESLGAYLDASFVLRHAGGSEVVRGQEVTSGLFASLAVEPIVGRVLQRGDDDPNAPGVVVVSESFWNERLGGRLDALGTAVTLGGAPHTVVGVMPAGFQAPSDHSVGGVVPSGGPVLWTPLTNEARAGNKSVSVLARLERGISIASAQERFSTAHGLLVAPRPEWQRARGVRMEGLLESVVGGVRSTLWFLLAAVGLVLVAAATNIANVLTALGLNRRRELAIRSALGAESGRLLRSLFVESAVLVALVGLGGVLVAWLSVPLLLRLLPTALPRHDGIGMSASVLFFGIAVSGVTAFAIGMFPALLASRTQPQEAMRRSARGLSEGHAASKFRAVLVVAEVSLAFVSWWVQDSSAGATRGFGPSSGDSLPLAWSACGWSPIERAIPGRKVANASRRRSRLASNSSRESRPPR